MSGPPDLPPIPASHANAMMDRRFGAEMATYYSGSQLNRVAWHRPEREFLSAALGHPSTTFVVLNNLAPLADSPARLARARLADVAGLVGKDYYRQSDEERLAEAALSNRPTDAGPPAAAPILIFLGLDEDEPQSAPGTATFAYGKVRGAPVFALDVTPRRLLSATHRRAAEQLAASLPAKLARDSRETQFLPGRTHTALAAGDAALYGTARSLADWNARAPHCAGCGQRTLALQGGWKRTCTNDTPAGVAAAAGGDPAPGPCPARRAPVSNHSFPRSDPTAIVAVLAPGLTHVLLGRQARWPARWYSCVAGFLEPGEAAEDAARREVAEETGVRVGRCQLWASQYWPYPCSLMLGCVAVAAAGEGPRWDEARGAWAGERAQGNDGELEDARWWRVEEVRAALREATVTLDSVTRDRGKGDAWVDEDWAGTKEGELRLPPKTAIAHQLIAAAVEWSGAAEEKL